MQGLGTDTRLMAWVIGVTFILLGCSGNGSDSAGPSVSAQGGRPTFSTSVPGDLTLGGLSDTENQQLCADTKAFYDAQGGVERRSLRSCGHQRRAGYDDRH